ncbi:MSC_0624 family F1-like ATPase-associated membrane protein [Mycoplasmopsis cricetuli]|uniref:MSC_0624 family F1-like ATPase-associated membrane protein n=1 Tax=Mycoplasmopsis cricetuli TaxID=171283 RepID=UPI00046FEC4B|nr:hypothetical protein [Mycoplasmopsis cricetuli]
MKENQLLFQKKFSLKISNKQLLKILNCFLISWLFLGSLFLLFFYKNTIFQHETFLNIFLDFSTPTTREINFLILFKSLSLFFIFFYSLAKNYYNLFLYKEILKKYFFWFVIYSLFSIIAFGLLLGFNPFSIGYAEASKQINLIYSFFYLSFIFIFLVISNIAQLFHSYIVFKKVKPLDHINKWVFIINAISQVIILILGILLFYFLIEKDLTTNRNTILNKGQTFEFLQTLFSIKSAKNLLIIIFSSIGLAILIFGINLVKIFAILTKKENIFLFKKQFIFLLSITLAALIWYLYLLIKINNKANEFIISEINFSILFGGILTLIVLSSISYFILNHLKWTKTKNKIINEFYLFVHLFVIWISVLIFYYFYSENYFWINIIVFIATTITFLILIMHLNKKINITLKMIILLVILVGILIENILAHGINQIILLADNQQLLIFSQHFSFGFISIVLILVTCLLLLCSSLIEFFNLNLSLFQFKKITSKSNNQTKKENK